MAGHWPPGQLQFHPFPQGHQGVQPAGHRPGCLAAVHTALPGGFPIRPVRILAAIPTMN